MKATNIKNQFGGSRAFTMTELLIVIAMLAILATMALPALERSNNPAWRVQCANNLRQVGVALNVYCAEANDFVPICGWANGQNPWQTYEACRVTPGTSTVTRGFEGLGLLFRTKVVTDARLFYCPAGATVSAIRSYDYFATTTNGWPSSPVGSGDNEIRVGYHYYPQSRVTQQVGTAYGSFTLPTLTYSTVILEFGGALSLPSPAKLTEVNPQKSITTDLLITLASLSHKEYGSPAGINALFPDGRVTFQTVRDHNKKGSAQPFDPNLWDPNTAGPANDPSAFRIIMNGWTP